MMCPNVRAVPSFELKTKLNFVYTAKLALVKQNSLNELSFKKQGLPNFAIQIALLKFSKPL